MQSIEQPPPELSRMGVQVQKLGLKKTIFVEKLDVGEVSDIKVDQSQSFVALAGTTSAAYASTSGKVISSVKYESKSERTTLIPTESPKKFKFLSRGDWGSAGCLFDTDGKVLWKAREKQGLDDIAFGIFGKAERFVVGYNGGSGVSMLDGNGKELWNEEDGNVWHVEVIGTGEDKDTQIVHSNAEGLVTVRDETGSVIRSVPAPFYFASFSLCRWPTPASPELLMSCVDGKVWLLDREAHVVKTFAFPSNAKFADIHGLPVQLEANKPRYLATITSWNLWNISVFCIHDQSGQLVYEDVIPDLCSSISTMPRSDSEAILVGGSDQVWKYALVTSK